MLVFGDQVRTMRPADCLDGIAAALGLAGAERQPILRHGALGHALIEAGMLLQGLADADCERAGHDAPSPAQDRAMALLLALARRVARSWTSGLRESDAALPPEWRSLADAVPAGALRVVRPEGFRLYALYPECYLIAAARSGLDRPAVVGLRSIGTTLAAMVAVATGAPDFATVRPVGAPFGRILRTAPALRQALLARPDIAIVDEGPGLSGSSFGSVADLLEDAGAAPARLVFFPSHGGAPGAEASERHARRWQAARRHACDFDIMGLDRPETAQGLDRWFADLVGEPLEPLADLAGGRWRAHRRFDVAPPVWPLLERRKYLMRTASGEWLLKFAGLGPGSAGKLARARRLHAAGLAPEPLALRHGFLIERWHRDATAPFAPSAGTPDVLPTLARYLGFRARHFPAAAEAGAPLPELRAMLARNVGQCLAEPVAGRLLARVDAALRRAAPPRRIHTDNRLPWWEWLRLADGAILKADATDHDCDHSLIGCQDVAWDIAGAAVEFTLPPPETERLCAAVAAEGQAAVDRALVAALMPCYAAFQTGCWWFAGEMPGPEQTAGIAMRERYRRQLEAMAEGGGLLPDPGTSERATV